MDQLMHHAWPGNVWEMQNILERAIVLASGKVIEDVDLPNGRAVLAGNGQPNGATSLPLRQWLTEQEKFYLAQQLEAYGGQSG
jgi:two-component system response regulator HydG